MKTIKEVIKINDKIQVSIMNTRITGIVTAFGTHKGRNVIDFIDKDGHNRFCYEGQIQIINNIDVDYLTTKNKQI